MSFLSVMSSWRNYSEPSPSKEMGRSLVSCSLVWNSQWFYFPNCCSMIEWGLRRFDELGHWRWRCLSFEFSLCAKFNIFFFSTWGKSFSDLIEKLKRETDLKFRTRFFEALQNAWTPQAKIFVRTWLAAQNSENPPNNFVQISINLFLKKILVVQFLDWLTSPKSKFFKRAQKSFSWFFFFFFWIFKKKKIFFKIFFEKIFYFLLNLGG